MDIVVKTRQGAVRGALVEGVAAFKGIPYAAPPFGARRFQPPQSAEAWDGVREAQVAEQLIISPRTVQGHMRSIFNKINVNSRTAATRYAIEHKLV